MQKTEPITARGIEITADALILRLSDGQVSIPWGRCSGKLAAASPAQRAVAKLSPGGYGVHWPLLDEDLSVSGLLRDNQKRKTLAWPAS